MLVNEVYLTILFLLTITAFLRQIIPNLIMTCNLYNDRNDSFYSRSLYSYFLSMKESSSRAECRHSLSIKKLIFVPLLITNAKEIFRRAYILLCLFSNRFFFRILLPIFITSANIISSISLFLNNNFIYNI